jgi:hypothetical protein
MSVSLRSTVYLSMPRITPSFHSMDKPSLPAFGITKRQIRDLRQVGRIRQPGFHGGLQALVDGIVDAHLPRRRTLTRLYHLVSHAFRRGHGSVDIAGKRHTNLLALKAELAEQLANTLGNINSIRVINTPLAADTPPLTRRTGDDYEAALGLRPTVFTRPVFRRARRERTQAIWHQLIANSLPPASPGGTRRWQRLRLRPNEIEA